MFCRYCLVVLHNRQIIYGFTLSKPLEMRASMFQVERAAFNKSCYICDSVWVWLCVCVCVEIERL